MDEEAGRVARAVRGSGDAYSDADLVFRKGVVFGQPGDKGAADPADRAVRLNGVDQFGRVRPVVTSDARRRRVALVDTSARFMFSTWVRPASVNDDQIAVSQAAADGSVFELGWIGGRWTFRLRGADNTVVAAVTRDMAQAGDGTPWTEHWVSLMGGYDPATKEIWLRTQAQGVFKVCEPDEPWNCQTKAVMSPETKVVPNQWTPSPGRGPLLFGATTTRDGRGSYWNGWLDDSQLWPLTHSDQAVLNVIYGETVPSVPASGQPGR